MAGNLYQDGLWISQGDPKKVNEQQTTSPTDSVTAGAVRQFVAGQLGKEIALPTSSGALSTVIYKYAQRKTAGATINAPYTLVGWSDTSTYTFDTDAAALPVAGVCFCDDNSASTLDQGVQKGNFGFIQVGGITYIQSESGVTAGDMVSSNNSGTVKKAAAAEKIVGTALENVGATLASHVLVLLGGFPRLSR